MPRRKKEDEIPGERPPPRGAANARERTRMRVLSRAFGRLKLTLPWVPPDTKLSKLDTLRLATSYITHLKKVLLEDPGSSDSSASPSTASYFDHDSKINLHCWPYGHHLRNSSSNGHNNSISSDNPKPEPHLLQHESDELKQGHEGSYYFNHSTCHSYSHASQQLDYIDYNSHTGASSQDLAHYELAYDSSYSMGE
ncbi:uncharacterized protein [Lepeophtheirus salmonis]|nr:transcription factor 24-like [Lepeophtheirus salmonis]